MLPEPDQTNLLSHVCSGKQGVKNKMPFIYVPTGMRILLCHINQVYGIFIFLFTQGCTELEPSIFQVEELCFSRCLFI